MCRQTHFPVFCESTCCQSHLSDLHHTSFEKGKKKKKKKKSYPVELEEKTLRSTWSTDSNPELRNESTIRVTAWSMIWIALSQQRSFVIRLTFEVHQEERRRRRRRRWRGPGEKRKLGPRSRKLIYFLHPLASLRGRPHTAHTSGSFNGGECMAEGWRHPPLLLL